ncbi:HSF-type DNA-binding domain protein [Ceratobasidium sp. AG-Ba]|nr:HSF-type DNA-binding domain protein [Ceratobasidium sp. AG-Ba]
MDRTNLHHHPHASYNRNLTLPPLPTPPFQSQQNPFPPLLTQRPAPYNAHLHPVPSPSQLEPIHPPPSSNWRRDDKREFPPIESGNGSGYSSYNGYPSRRDTYADSRSNSSRVVPSVSEVPKDVDDNMPPTSDFVKKLYKMLEDPQFGHVVTWGPQGDCFVVKDVTEFTKSILPRMFKHSNFASFVRQLNKYDFHKLKNAEAEAGGMGYGDQSWTFKHPDFRADDRDALENIKRKVPAARKSKGGPAPTPSAPPAQSNGTKTEAASPAPEVAASPSGSGGEPSRESDTIRMLVAQVEAMRASQETTRRAHEEQIEGLRRTAEDVSAHIRNLETNYQNVLGEIVHFQRNMANQDNLMQNLIGYFIGMENKKTSNGTGNTPPPDNDPQHQFMNGPEASKIFDLGPQDVARASFEQMNEISRRAERSGMSFTDNSGMSGNQGGAAQNMGGGMPSGNMGQNNAGSMAPGPAPMNSGVGTSMNSGVSGATMIGGKPVQAMTREEVLGRVEDLQRERPDQPFTHSSFMPMISGPLMERQRQEEESHKGLQVITLGHLVPRDGTQNQQGGAMGNNMDYQQNQHHPQTQSQTQSAQSQQQMGHGQDMMGSYSPPANYHGPTPSTSGAGSSAGAGGKSLRVRRSTYVPGWAVPPRVLLVDDDAVNLRLSKKFLQVFGCTIDVAVDGVGAVDKMNLEKYDLVLMDIVMPKMDGVSATSLIRRFDHMTPIISMTSNSKPNEIMTYYSSGMNDILPKPFSKEGLFEMLEKHLMHLKQIHQLGQFPRGVSIPPMNDAHMLDYMQHHSNNEASSSSNHAVGFANGTKTPGAFNGFGSYEDDGNDPGKVEPFAALGLTEESYRMLMGEMMTQEGSGFFGDSGMDGSGRGKRGMDDDVEDGGGKRPRFEEIVD